MFKKIRKVILEESNSTSAPQSSCRHGGGGLRIWAPCGHWGDHELRSTNPAAHGFLFLMFLNIMCLIHKSFPVFLLQFIVFVCMSEKRGCRFDHAFVILWQVKQEKSWRPSPLTCTAEVSEDWGWAGSFQWVKMQILWCLCCRCETVHWLPEQYWDGLHCYDGVLRWTLDKVSSCSWVVPD